MVYADTSALLKRYLREAFSEDFDDFFMNHGPLSVSRLSIVEARCSLARRRRNALIDKRLENRAVKELNNDIRDGALELHAVDDAQIADAFHLIESLPAIPLRSLDALHLAIARNVHASGFATADRRQADAAEALGFTVHRFY